MLAVLPLALLAAPFVRRDHGAPAAVHDPDAVGVRWRIVWLVGLGLVVFYADKVTDSMRMAMNETERRRTLQAAYNEAHGITPQTIKKNVEDILAGLYKGDVDMNRVTASICLR